MKSNRYVLFAGAAAVLLIALLAGLSLRDRNVPVAASPSPTATASPTTGPTSPPTGTPSTSPAAQGVYLGKKLGFALEIAPPWRKATCGNIDVDPVGERAALEHFTNTAPLDEFIGHVGSSDHRVYISVRDNPRGLSPMEFTSGRNPIGSGVGFGSDSVRSTTLAGRAAAEFGEPGGPSYGYLVAEGDLMYLIYYLTARMQPAQEPAVAMTAIVRSFRFLTAAERQALPDPTPIPATAPTAQALAASLKTAFEAKDVASLERLLAPCVNNGVQNGGGSLVSRERYVAELRTQFAAGLAVTVDASQMRTGDVLGADATLVRSRWNAFPPGQGPVPSPGAQTLNVELILQPTQGGFYWRGTLVVGSS